MKLYKCQKDLAKQIVEAHKGRVWVESEGINKGSTFFMELDAVK